MFRLKNCLSFRTGFGFSLLGKIVGIDSLISLFAAFLTLKNFIQQNRPINILRK